MALLVWVCQAEALLLSKQKRNERLLLLGEKQGVRSLEQAQCGGQSGVRSRRSMW
jgi:hypothetical protein